MEVAPASQEINVTANRTQSNMAETAESVAVISRPALETTSGVPLDITLRQLPGFTLFRRSDSREANPTSQGVSLRGVGASGASRALVLYQGIPLNDPFGGWVYWGRIPNEAVGSVEVLRGGGSSLYGSNALSGVINILPRKPEQNLCATTLSVATQNTPDLSVLDSLKIGSWRLENSAEVFRTSGYMLVPAGQRGTVDANAASSHQGFQTLVSRTLSSGDLWTSGSFYNESRDNGTQAQNNRTQLWQIVTGANFLMPVGSFQFRGHGSGESFNQTFSSVVADRNSESLVNAQHVPVQEIGASLLWLRELGKRNSLVAGADAQNVYGRSDDLGFAASRPRSQVNAGGSQLSAGIFIQDLLRLTSGLLLSAGGRYDNWDNYDARSQTIPFVATVHPALTRFTDHSEHAFTPRAALLFTANRRLTFTGSAYKSFRAPTLNELYRTFRLGNTLTLANSGLLAERLSGAESGANLFLGPTHLHAAFFWMEVSNPVANVTLSTTPALIIRHRQNLGRTRSRGVEADVEWRIKRIDLRGGYQFVDAEVASFPTDGRLVGLQLPQMAPHQFTAHAGFSMPRHWRFVLLARRARSQFDDDQNRFPLDAFLQMDAYVSRQLHRGAEVFAAVENMTGSRVVIARTPLVNLGPPTAVRVGIRFSVQ